MGIVTTVTGPVSPAQLGHTQCHEHLLISPGVSSALNPALCIDSMPASIQETKSYLQAGGKTLVDAQPIGCNRMELQLAQLAQATGLQLIASTGFHKACFYPPSHWLFTATQKQLTHIFSSELSLGMFHQSESSFPETRIPNRAGMVKTALETEGLTPQAVKCFSAAAAAAVENHTPLMVHTDPQTNPLELLAFLTAQGVSPQQIIFSHLDRSCPQLKTHQALCQAGCYLEYDTIQRPRYHSDQEEITLIKTMLAQGWENQLLLSLDTTRQRLRAYGGTPGLDYILCHFIPAMEQVGIPKEQVLTITRSNPQQLFSNL